MPVRSNEHSGSFAATGKNLTFSVVKGLLHKLKEQDRLIVHLFLETGLKPKELVELRHADFLFTKHTLVVPKSIAHNDVERRHSLSHELTDALRTFGNTHSHYFFRTTKHPQLSLREVHRVFARLSSFAGTKITSHDLRKLHIANQPSLGAKQQQTSLQEIDEKNTLTANQYASFVESFSSDRDRLLVELLYHTGCQVHELLTIRIDDVRHESKELVIRSRDSRRTTVLSTELSDALLAFIRKKKLKKQEFLFNNNGKALSATRVYQIVTSHRWSSKAFVCPQTLRFSGIASMLSSQSLSEVKTQTGLASLDRFCLYHTLYPTHG